MKNLNRRNFIKKTSVASAGISAVTILPSAVWGAKVAPSDQVNVAIIGCRNKGFGILKNHLDFEETNCVAMCDVDRNVLEEKATEVRNTYGDSPKLYGDFREMLNQTDIDVVIIGTPDHWHCLNTVYSLQAGKDVYVEKPMANTIEECNIMTRAANYYNRVVQVGQQQRSNQIFIDVMKLIKSGKIGALRKVNIWANFNYGLGADPAMDSQVPEGVDYNMWLGPAPKRPFNQNHFHGSWRHFWNYGGGMFSDWGVHLIDMGLWAKDQVKAPAKVMTFATNNSSFNKKRDTFDTQTAIFPTKDYVINYEMVAGVQEGPYDSMYGVSFIGDYGTIKANRNRYRLIPEWDSKNEKHWAESLEVEGGKDSHSEHVRNFIDCVKSRKTPACPPEVGRVAAIHVHAANIAARIGEPCLNWDDKNNRFTNSETANSYIVPSYRAPWSLPKID
ncbi:Gfo/Idh/MocA family oxidoreductase [uncultured Draconibacterium sp.]|uniref:Gfo/Idh/MocA family protein n=1 Tax=uncultured Draconibacterium sp. TaxID=1573823 RepID=UPI0029C8545B|nr:Gfo/Idh/MocA family oxidoreductase [uncultured Draconibacterium sp.]